MLIQYKHSVRVYGQMYTTHTANSHDCATCIDKTGSKRSESCVTVPLSRLDVLSIAHNTQEYGAVSDLHRPPPWQLVVMFEKCGNLEIVSKCSPQADNMTVDPVIRTFSKSRITQ